MARIPDAFIDDRATTTCMHVALRRAAARRLDIPADRALQGFEGL